MLTHETAALQHLGRVCALQARLVQNALHCIKCRVHVIFVIYLVSRLGNTASNQVLYKDVITLLEHAVKVVEIR